MSIFDRSFPVTAFAKPGHLRLVLPIYAGTLFISATLLFALQPMFAKMVLPLLGGSPSVWSVAMVFFQAMLLLGYCYAHAVTRWLDPRYAAAAHVCVLLAALTTLPVAVAGGFATPPGDGAGLWLIGLFAVSVGLPFFAIAANAPLLQSWFARTGHSQAADPYFLYGASNLGSFFALLAYPFIIEPFFTLREQSFLWSGGFVILLVLIAIAGGLLIWTMALKGNNARAVAAPDADASAAPVAWRERAVWTALAFVPSALLVAVTSHISTDIAAAPFLWVIPLTLFLATFVLTFRTGGGDLHAWLLRFQPLVAAPLVINLMNGERAFWIAAIMLNLGMLFVSAMICHRELYKRRPDARHLTEFYMWLSLGGVLGGVFSGLLAPNIFSDVWEYPILIVLALLCRPGTWSDLTAWRREGLLFAGAIVLAPLPSLVFGVRLPAQAELLWMAVLVACAAAIVVAAERPVRLVGLTAFALVLTAAYRPGLATVETARSFFGVHKVVESHDGRFRLLYHGTTIHGAQRLRDDAGAVLTGRPEPLTYYYFGGPISEAIRAARIVRGNLSRVAVVGLGTGSLACHAQAGEEWRYYEIDPAVVRIARDETKFRFLAACAPNIPVVIGDARLTLAEGRRNDLIILDAFSSDVIPVHLLTREAMRLYLEQLAADGLLVLHISNRYLELASVVAEVAATYGLTTYVKQDVSVFPEDYERSRIANALVAVVARREQDLSALGRIEGWHKQPATGEVRPWTDDYSNIPSAIWRMATGR